VVCFSDTELSQGEKYPVIRIKRGWLKLWSHRKYLAALSKASRGADCIYAQGPTAGGWQARTVARRLHLPLVVKVVGDYAWEQARVRFGLDCTIEEFQTKQNLPLIIERLRSLQQKVVSDAQRVVVPSNYLAGLVRGWGVKPADINVIYNSFAPNFHASAAQSARANIFITGGRLVPWKGFDTLIKLWPRVTAEFPDAQLLIVGDGPDAERLRQLLEDTGDTASVKLLGRLTADQMVEQLRRAKAFILNSDYEGMSHMVLEAMAAGVIPLVSRRGGNEELVTNGVTGWTFGYNNPEEILAAVVRIAQLPAQDQVMQSAVSERSRQFTPQAMIDQTMAVLAEVIKAHSRV
jgi:glycosyltransferase involved in cell wall biosynthesis